MPKNNPGRLRTRRHQAAQLDEDKATGDPYDRLTLELSEIRMLAEMIDLVEEGGISPEQASLLGRTIQQKVDAAVEHARATLTDSEVCHPARSKGGVR